MSTTWRFCNVSAQSTLIVKARNLLLILITFFTLTKLKSPTMPEPKADRITFYFLNIPSLKIQISFKTSDGSNTILLNIERTQTSFLEH